MRALPLPTTRAGLESLIERLIALLDAMDAPAEDLEDTGDDEPSLGSLARLSGADQRGWAGGGDDDREDGCV